ncbi:MAG: transposase [Muribaculaceae bacterium]|nr:transposase [Muribaculaceae bacterium]
MANTYTQIYLHIIFAVKNRNSLLPPVYIPKVHAYIGGVLRNLGHYPCSVGGIDSHVHMLVGYNVNQSIPDMVRDVKSSASRYINDSHFIPYRFEWQAGYGCFSHARSQVDVVCKYIRNQYQHHKNITLTDEIRSIFEKCGMRYDERYIISEPE